MTLGDALVPARRGEWVDRRVIRPLGDPPHRDGGIAVLRGNLGPDGAVIKHHAAYTSTSPSTN